MNTLPLFLSIGTIHVLGVISPGPDFAYILRTTLASGRRAGIAGAAGIATSIIFYTILTIGGIAQLAREWSWFSTVLRVGGGLFLIYLGGSILWSKLRHPQGTDPGVREAAPPVAARHAYRNGVLTNLLNPKAIVYFTSILAPAFTREVPVSSQIGIGAMIIVTTFLWFAFLACAVSDRRLRDRIQRALPAVDVVLGLGLAAFGIKTLLG